MVTFRSWQHLEKDFGLIECGESLQRLNMFTLIPKARSNFIATGHWFGQGDKWCINIAPNSLRKNCENKLVLYVHTFRGLCCLNGLINKRGQSKNVSNTIKCSSTERNQHISAEHAGISQILKLDQR